MKATKAIDLSDVNDISLTEELTHLLFPLYHHKRLPSRSEFQSGGLCASFNSGAISNAFSNS